MSIDSAVHGRQKSNFEIVQVIEYYCVPRIGLRWDVEPAMK